MIPRSRRSQEWAAFLADLHPGRSGGVSISTGNRDFEGDLKQALEASERFVMTRPDSRAHIYGLLEEIGLAIPLDLAVQYAAQRTATLGELPQDDPVKLQQFFELVVWPVVRAQDTMMLALADRSDGLSILEGILLRGMLPLAAAFDRLFFAWRAKVVVPYQLGLREDPGLKEVVSQACPNHYSVLVRSEGGFFEGKLSRDVVAQLCEVPFVIAFPEEIGEITGILEVLIRSLRDAMGDTGLPLEQVSVARAYRNYFRALKDAIVESNLSDTEEVWADVDWAWLKIGPNQRVMPVHMMEDGYQHPTTVAPEFRVLYRSTELARLITALRRAIAPFGAEAGDSEYVKKLEGIDADAFILMAGGTVDFRLAGQSVPNRSEVQEQGMKAILDVLTMKIRQAQFEHLIRTCFGQKTLQWLEKHFSLLAHLIAVIAHELGHPWLINAKIKPAFGAHKPSFEETKATILGLKAMLGIKASFEGQLGPEMVAYLIGEILRRFAKNMAANSTFRPYYNEAKTIATCFMGAGILYIQDGKLELNQELCQDAEALVALLEEPLARLTKAYQTAFNGQGEEGLAQALAVVAEFAPDPLSPELAELYKTVNANLERAQG